MEQAGRINKLNNVENLNNDWEVLNITVDSGAIDNVLSQECASQFGTKETRMSKNGGYYTAANDTKIFNEGERVIKGYTNDGKPGEMTFQVCKVNGPLGSVRKMCKAGNRVVFDEEGSFIEHKETGRKTRIIDDGGMYVLQLRIPKNAGKVVLQGGDE